MAHDHYFKTVTPESVGIPSSAITSYVRKLKELQLREHSILILRGGKICAEGYAPFCSEEKLHRAYSVSKTFVTAAIGRLIFEGRLSIDDKVAQFFPDKLPEVVPPEIEEMTVRHLLMMSTPHDGTTYTWDPEKPDWTGSFFTTKPSHIPGTIFNYDTSGTFILNVLVERMTGMPIMEYLKETVFRDMDFSKDSWCVKAPDGYSWCGSGVLCTARDLAKLGLVFMNGGYVGNTQVLPEDFVKEATSRMIDNNLKGRAENCYDGYGYGYFIWRTWKNTFSFIGMGDQLVICIPEKDMMVVTHADNQGSSRSQMYNFKVLWDCLMDHVVDGALPENPEAYKEMLEEISDLSLPIPNGKAHSMYQNELNDRVYVATRENEMGITKFSFHFDGDEGEFRYTNARGDKVIRFGLGKYVDGEFPEEYSGEQIHTPAGRYYKCTACAVFVEPQKLLLRCDVVDWYFGSVTATFGFRDDVCGFRMVKNAEAFMNDYFGWGEGRLLKDE